MTKAMEELRQTLVSRIESAGSCHEVKNCCESAVRELEDREQLEGHAIVVFLEKTVAQLTRLNPMQLNATQWSYIIQARVFCNRLIQRYSFAHE